jgi:hypothetical protein
MAETLEISLKADTRELVNALKELPGIGAKEARDMVRGMQREYRKAERAAKQTAQQTKKEFQDGFEGVGKVLKAFEGQVGGAFSVFEDFSEGLNKASGVLGTVGTTIGAVTLGAAASAFALQAAGAAAVSLATGAIEADKRLRDLGIANASTSAEVASLESSMGALNAATDLATVAIATSGLQIDKFLQITAGGLVTVAELADKLESVATTAQSVGRVMAAIGSIGASELLFQGLEAAENKGRDLETQISAVATETEELGATPVRTVEDLRDTIRQSEQAAADAARRMSEWRGDTDKLQDIIDEMGSDQLTDLQLITIKYQDLREQVVGLAGDEAMRADALTAINDREMRELDNLSKARDAEAQAELDRQRELSDAFDQRMTDMASNADEASAAANEAISSMGGELQGFWEQVGQDVLGTFDAITSVASDMLGSFTELNNMRIDELREQAEQEVEAAEKANEAWYNSQTAKIERDLEAGRISQKEAIEERKRINEEMRAKQKAAQGLAKDERRAALKSWRANKTIERTQAIMGAAKNAIALTPAFAYMGVGAPIAAAALAAASLVPQLAVINRQKPPEFPMGGMVSPDHMLVGAQAGEGVATRRGVAAMGGPEQLARFNEGQRGGGDRIIVQLGRRTLADAVRDVQRDLQSVLLDPRVGQLDFNGGA